MALLQGTLIFGVKGGGGGGGGGGERALTAESTRGQSVLTRMISFAPVRSHKTSQSLVQTETDGDRCRDQRKRLTKRPNC